MAIIRPPIPAPSPAFPMHDVKPASFICQIPGALPDDVDRDMLDLFRRAPSA
jgi:hypothetical protein